MKRLLILAVITALIAVPCGSGAFWGTLYISEATGKVGTGQTAIIPVKVHPGAKLFYCEITVIESLGMVWDARYEGGASQGIVAERSGKMGTVAGAFFNEHLDDPITSGKTNILITPAGGGRFSGKGIVKATVHYYSDKP